MINLKLKKAKPKDSKFLWNLRNEKKSRLMFSEVKYIKFSDHKIWFKNELKNKKNKVLIAYINTQKIGYVRFLKKNFYFEVSINVKKNKRRRKLSSEILSQAERQISKNSIFIAKVQKRNFISMKLFKSLNYTTINQDKDYCYLAKVKHQNSKTQKYINIINKIEEVRKKNNINWMQILKIAFENSPVDASKIMSSVHKSDSIIGKFAKRLSS